MINIHAINADQGLVRLEAKVVAAAASCRYLETRCLQARGRLWLTVIPLTRTIESEDFL